MGQVKRVWGKPQLSSADLSIPKVALLQNLKHDNIAAGLQYVSTELNNIRV